MAYVYEQVAEVLDENTPLVSRDQLLAICKEIDDTTETAETDLFIKSGHSVVKTLLDGYGIPTSLLTTIELYLCAHFAALTYPTVSREGLGPLSKSYSVTAGYDFQATRYGCAALALDPTGVLADKKTGVSVRSPLGFTIPTTLQENLL